VLLHALAGGCEEDMGSLVGDREYGANSFPGNVSDSIFQPALQPPEARFPWHETGFWISEQLFVVLADGVGYEYGRDFGAHGIGLSGVLFWWRWEELGSRDIEVAGALLLVR
jgi:hypothetical protein